jgi:hypothetical protein
LNFGKDGRLCPEFQFEFSAHEKHLRDGKVPTLYTPEAGYARKFIPIAIPTALFFAAW